MKMNNKILLTIGIVFIIGILVFCLFSYAHSQNTEIKRLSGQVEQLNFALNSTIEQQPGYIKTSNENINNTEFSSAYSFSQNGTKTQDSIIVNPLTLVNPRHSYLNFSNSEVAYVTHTGDIGGIGNLTFNTTGSGYGFFSYIGIGTKKPTQLLDVRGNANFSGTVYVNNGTDVSTFLANGTYPWFRYLNVSGEIVTGNTNISGAGGRVGIGTSAPTHTLNVVGTSNFTQNAIFGQNITILPIDASGGNNLILEDINDTALTSYFNSSTLMFDTQSFIKLLGINYTYDYKWKMKGVGSAGTPGSNLLISLYTNNTAFGTTSETNVLTLSNSGYVGIGTTAPVQTLDVMGDMNVTATAIFDYRVGIGTGLAPAYLLETKVSPIAVNLSGVLYVNGTNGNIGIGDTTPASLLTVGNGDLFQVNSAGAMSNTVSTVSANAIYGLETGAGGSGVVGVTIGAGATGYGVYGAAFGVATTNYGVYGTASGGTTNNYGVYGTASGTGAYAGYFDGNVLLASNLVAESNTWGTCNNRVTAGKGLFSTCLTGEYMAGFNQTANFNITSIKCCML